MNPEVMIYIWLGLTIMFSVIEALTVGLTSIWCAAGALCAMIATAMGMQILGQIIVFLVVSGFLLIVTRPLAKRFIMPKIKPTNADALIGQSAIVLETIHNDAGTGAVRIAGKVWTARSEQGVIIPKDEKVVVIRIEGVKLFVRI